MTRPGGRVGLLFQPRWAGKRSALRAALGVDAPAGRERVVLTALDALVRGDASLFGDLFTDDVVVSSPHFVVTSLGALQAALGCPEDALTELEIVALAS